MYSTDGTVTIQYGGISPQGTVAVEAAQEVLQ
jgi:hypothetical protein